jgi:hypothetical protein
MATRRSLTDRNITDLILKSDSDAHASEDYISAQSDSDTGDTTDPNCTQWPDNTNVSTYTNCSPQGYRRPQWVTTEAPHVNKTLPLSVFMLFCFEIIQLFVEETNRYYHQYSTWT